MPRFLGLRGNSLNIVAILGVLMPGILTTGYNASLLGGVLTLKNFEEQFPEINIAAAHDKSHASTVQGLVVASYTIGGFFGTLSCIWLGDVFGRRRTIMAGSVIQVLGAVLMASAGSLAQLFTSRVILGVGTGVLLATIPLWQSEISPAEKRGAHVGMKGIFSGFGCALALFLDFGMSFTKGSVAWRFPFAIPRWLIRQGRLSEASEVLAALEDTSVEDEAVEAKIKDVQTSLDLFKEKSLGQIFHMGPQRTFHRAILAALAMLFLQLTGSTVITFYTTAIFENNLSLGNSTSTVLAAVYQLVGPLGGAFCVLKVDGLGRRVLLLGSAIGNTVCLALVAGLGTQADNPLAMRCAVFFIFLFHFSYIIGFGAIPYLYATEIAPLHLRTTINSFSISISWAVSIILTSVTPIAFNSMGQTYFVIFAGLNAMMIPIIYYLFPETAGRSLEEMDKIFALSRGVLDAVKVARLLQHGQEIDQSLEKDLDPNFKCPELQLREVYSA
ncbi:Major facilitator superfamily domain general substrate transporter [Penicillium coprophilum]|uniref:Major facilitator superfamily domain general substrate transporter n=1 Tax=Penicillium coprophilum TaxID=36646 RepID=UPI00239BFB69|nr:Major facilitator superfamily domain general substrate transporter [Penicillium coprophilum]KAJ5169371.1 Major facilitator superfamily domain general substrate transporter [Penicillium coprophilum]